MMSCEENSELLSLFIDGQLNKTQKKDLLKHLETCAECRNELSELKKLVAGLNDLPDMPLPDGFHESFMKRLVAEPRKLKKPRKPVFARLVSYAASLLVLIFAGTMMINRPELNMTSEADSFSVKAGANDVSANSEEDVSKAENNSSQYYGGSSSADSYKVAEDAMTAAGRSVPSVTADNGAGDSEDFSNAKVLAPGDSTYVDPVFDMDAQKQDEANSLANALTDHPVSTFAPLIIVEAGTMEDAEAHLEPDGLVDGTSLFGFPVTVKYTPFDSWRSVLFISK